MTQATAQIDCEALPRMEDAAIAELDSRHWESAYAKLSFVVAHGAPTPATRLNLALAADRIGLDGRDWMQTLGAQHPDWHEPHLRLAESLRRSGDLEGAIAAYERALAVNACCREAMLSLGVLMMSCDALHASRLLLTCCGFAPGLADSWDALGVALMARGDPFAAESAFSEAQSQLPGSVAIAVRRAEAAFMAETAALELARLEQGTAANPLDVAQLTARGFLLNRLGQPNDAADVLETAAALAPDAPIVAATLAYSQLNAAKYKPAVHSLRRAVALTPGDVSLRNDLGAALNRTHNYREAREIIEAVIAEHGESPVLLSNLCNSLVSLGFQHEGAEAATRATVIAPESHLAWRTLGNALAYSENTRAVDLLGVFRQASRLVPRGNLAAPEKPRQPERRLRLGLLSGTLRTHPVGWLTLAGFEALDRAQFDIVCFGQPPSTDLLQRRFHAAASEWNTVSGQSRTDVARRIRSNDIDILIDLGGWGDQGLVGACAERPAPIQVKWVGMQNHSTGLGEMDWLISDRWQTPVGSEQHYAEQLLRMPDGYVCYDAPYYAPAVTALPALDRRGVTFGCFNNLAKIGPGVIACWATILRRVPDSRLVLKTHQYSDRLTAERFRCAFGALGVDRSRLEFRGSSTHRSQLAQHGDVDIMLDPFPYSGGLTTCEALWMGVPVVTLAGEIFASRHSTSHLTNVGLADWVAYDEQQYTELAIACAADIRRLKALRADMRPRVRQSALCDAPRFGVNLGRALRGVWQQACCA
ncbi:MAG TPA: tetratricopeptide repeat protein [Bradyrhizobium sp.]